MTGRPIELDLQPRIEAGLARLREGTGERCLSEYAFANLYLFREAHRYRFNEGDWPGVSGVAYDGTTHFMPLFDLRAAPAEVLLALVAEHGCLYPIPAEQAAALPTRTFEASASRDDADYLYAASSFAGYPGRPLAKKRNLVRQFLAAHVPSSEPYGEHLAPAAREVLRDWMRQKSKAEGEADERACLEAISHAARFGLKGRVFFAEGQAIGFVLAQALQPGVFAVRFAKALDLHHGIYPYMFQRLCLEFGQPVEWLNFEQDMGISGFRRSKMSYAPTTLLQKLRVRARAGSHFAQDRPPASA